MSGKPRPWGYSRVPLTELLAVPMTRPAVPINSERMNLEVDVPRLFAINREIKTKMKSHRLLALAILMSAATLKAQANPEIVQPILTRQLQSPQVVTFQLQRFLEAKVPA